MRIERDKIKYNITCNSNNAMCITNSCDSVVYLVTKYCVYTILTQSICLLILILVIDHGRNLVSPSNLLSIILANSKENTKTLNNILQHYFDIKKNKVAITELLDRDDNSILHWLELHNAKFLFSTHN